MRLLKSFFFPQSERCANDWRWKKKKFLRRIKLDVFYPDRINKVLLNMSVIIYKNGDNFFLLEMMEGKKQEHISKP